MNEVPRNLTDWAFSVILGRTPFYRGGWGDLELIESLVQRFDAFEEPAPIDVRWVRDEPLRKEGYFATPIGNFPLPPEARTAWFQLLLPWTEDEAPKPPVCVYLAATADEGYYYRRFVAAPLLRQGIGALILENPYYGRRRPRAQRDIAPPRFVDQMMMNLATIEEARSLLWWLRDRGYEYTGISGYSMGGFMSAYVAGLTDFPIAAIPAAAGNSAARVFTETYFRNVPDWDALAADLMTPHETPQERFVELVESLRVDRLPQPVELDSAIIVAARHDAIVPPFEAIALHQHWKGSELRWIEAGHISGFFARLREMRRAIVDAFSVRVHLQSRS